MNSLLQLKTIRPLLITLTLICFALLPQLKADCPSTCNGSSTAVGNGALNPASTGINNTAVGTNALADNTSGQFNVAVGAGALANNKAGFQNMAVGADALAANIDGNFNMAIGFRALLMNQHGGRNTAVGAAALLNDTASDNTAIGSTALRNNGIGLFNTAIGSAALSQNTAGYNNTAVGHGALANSSGSHSIAIGASAGINVGSSNNVIAIGSPGDDTDNTCFIGNIRDVTTQIDDAIGVVVDSAGQLGTLSSSCRFKKDIQPMGKASEAVLALKPVTFRYKNGKKGMPQFGLIAEEVAEVNADLVVRDQNGEIYTVRYDAVNAMLLNEFLKEHGKIEQQRKHFEAAIAQQQKGIEALTAAVKEQAAQIQKVSAQLELNKPAPQTVVNNR